jgi:ribosome biogenesis GTPase / thiamine phosphate phosphatase
MADKRPDKIRAQFRKNRVPRARQEKNVSARGWNADDAPDDFAAGERISGKGELTRKRTVVGDAGDAGVVLKVDHQAVKSGRVLAVQGLLSTVEAEDGALFSCTTRRLLKTIATDQRHVVAAGDFVLFRPSAENEGVIERVEPRKTAVSRATRGRRQIIVANVDQLIIVASAAEPYLKPNLIDRFLASAHNTGLRPLVCINKIDLVDPVSLVSLTGGYSQLGYRVLLVSAVNGAGIDRLRVQMAGSANVVVGQSGVGKSSLLNAVDPTLERRVAEVSSETQKGKHTTTTAQLCPLASGGYVVDTPGIRQFQLWDIVAAEVAGYFRDIRPYSHLCKFPDCTHTHESGCAVKDAVADGRLNLRRYESYCSLFAGEMD